MQHHFTYITISKLLCSTQFCTVSPVLIVDEMSAVHYWMLKERAETSLLEKITMLMHGGKQIFRFWPKLMCYTPTPTPRHGKVISVIYPISPLSMFINCILCFKLLIICMADMEISWQLPNAFYFEIMFRMFMVKYLSTENTKHFTNRPDQTGKHEKLLHTFSVQKICFHVLFLSRSHKNGF